jgi:hypothetical protein
MRFLKARACMSRPYCANRYMRHRVFSGTSALCGNSESPHVDLSNNKHSLQNHCGPERSR